MSESYIKAIVIISPLQTTLAPLPFHGIGLDSVDRFQAHFVEFALLGHAFDSKRACVPILHSLDVEIEPGSIMSNVCVWKAIPTHVTSEMLMISL